jgi:hypothetical protein
LRRDRSSNRAVVTPSALAVLLEKFFQFHFLTYFGPNVVCREELICFLGQKEMSFTDTNVFVGSDVFLELLLGC